MVKYWEKKRKLCQINQRVRTETVYIVCKIKENIDKIQNIYKCWQRLLIILFQIKYINTIYFFLSIFKCFYIDFWARKRSWMLKRPHLQNLLARTCVSWPIRADLVFRRAALKRQEENQCFRQRWLIWDTLCIFFSIKACKPIVL